LYAWGGEVKRHSRAGRLPVVVWGQTFDYRRNQRNQIPREGNDTGTRSARPGLPTTSLKKRDRGRTGGFRGRTDDPRTPCMRMGEHRRIPGSGRRVPRVLQVAAKREGENSRCDVLLEKEYTAAGFSIIRGATHISSTTRGRASEGSRLKMGKGENYFVQ